MISKAKISLYVYILLFIIIVKNVKCLDTIFVKCPKSGKTMDSGQ